LLCATNKVVGRENPPILTQLSGCAGYAVTRSRRRNPKVPTAVKAVAIRTRVTTAAQEISSAGYCPMWRKTEVARMALESCSISPKKLNTVRSEERREGKECRTR